MLKSKDREIVKKVILLEKLSLSEHKEDFDEINSEPSDSSSDNDDSHGGKRDPGPYEIEYYNDYGDPCEINYKKLTYAAVKRQINNSYEQDTCHRYSSALDILASYLKGQKIIYMESRASVISILNRLMLPSIFMSAAISVLQS